LTNLLQESQMDITIIEADQARCLELAVHFPKAEIICGDARDQSVLESQEISSVDALVSLTGVDETNMVISLYAHNREVSQIVTRMEYLESFGITENLPLGSVISPHTLSCSNIVRYVRAMQNQTGAAITIHSIAGGQAEAMEFRVDANTLHCGVPLKKLKLKEHILLVGISSGTRTQIPNGDSSFDIGDSVVVVASGDTVIGQLNDIFA
jgi:trk system potassium uptake protein TrkA